MPYHRDSLTACPCLNQSPEFPLSLSLPILTSTLRAHPQGYQNQDATWGQWAPNAPGPPLGPRSLSVTWEWVPDAQGQGLGSRGLFVPLWQLVDPGSWRNRPKIVVATQTVHRHQCTPLCNNTNFVAA